MGEDFTRSHGKLSTSSYTAIELQDNTRPLFGCIALLHTIVKIGTNNGGDRRYIN